MWSSFTSSEFIILVICIALLLPRIFALAVNSVLDVVLRNQSIVDVSVGGISLRRITEIRVKILSLPVPASLGLACKLHVSVDEVAWQPSLRKLLNVRIKGATVHLLIDDALSSQSTNQSSSSEARPSLGTRAKSIPDVLNCMSVQQSSATPSVISRFYCYMSERFLVSIIHALSVSLSSVSLIATKERSTVIVKIASLNVDVDPAISHVAHNVNVRCGGIEVRVEKDYEQEKRFYNEAAFTESFKVRNWNDGQQAFNALFLASTVTSAHLKVQPVQPMSAPPLLTIEPLTVCAEVTVQGFKPSGITRVEIRGQGARIHIDPLRLISSVTITLVAYRRVIAILMHEARLRKAQQEVEEKLNSTNVSNFSSGTSPIIQATRQRDLILRFLPQAMTFALHRVTITLYQRSDDSTRSLISSLSKDVFDDLMKECSGPSPVDNKSVDQLPFTPITERLDISMALLLIQAHVKMRYPLNDSNSLVEDSGFSNLISSLDASLAISRGPQINISQMCEPLMSVHSFKLDTSIMASSNTDFVPTRRSNSFSETQYDEEEILAIKHGNTAPALFHPLGTLRPTNSQSVSAVLVTPHINLSPSIGRWIDFLASVGNRASSLALLIPGIISDVSPPLPTSIGVTIPLPDNLPAAPTLLLPHSFDLTSFPKSIESWSKDIGGERLEVLVVHRASRSIFKHPAHSHQEHQQEARQAVHDRVDVDQPVPKRTYIVRHHVVITLKVISNAKISLYPSIQSQARTPLPSNPQQHHEPLFSLSIDEISLRFEIEPYSSSKHSFKNSMSSSSQDSFAPLFSQRVVGYNRSVGPIHPKHSIAAHPPNCVISTAPRVRMDISLSTVVASLPFSYSVDPLVLAPHEGEVIKQRGRLMTLQSASFVIDGGSPDITLNADGFNLRYSHSLLQLLPEVAQFIIELIPLQILKFDPTFDNAFNKSSSSKPFIPAAPGSFDPLAPPLLPKPNPAPAPPGAYPVPAVRLKGTITNVTIDFPYALEFGNDAQLDSNGFPVTESDEQEIREITEKTLSEIRRFNERVTMKAKAEQEHKAAEQSDAQSHDPSQASASSSSPTIPASASSSNSSDPTPPAVRKTSLFTFMCTEASLDVFLPTSQWSITLTHAYCLHETIPFMTIESACLEGANPTATTCKSLNVTASGVEGDWSPGMFLGLWKLIKDVTAAAINAKHGLFGDDGLALISLTGPVASMTSELDYQNNPTLSLLSTKKNHLDAFRLWYHHVRPRFLSEPYMYVNLEARKISLRACLNRLETLQAFIVVDEFSSKMVPNDFTFKGITVDLLMHPLIHVDSVKLRRRGLDLTPIDATYSEEQNLLMEYLDLDLSLSGVRVELAPQMDIGPLLETIILKVQAVVTSIWELPSLDFLSRRMGGPGYHGPPAPPAPGVSIVINMLEFSMIDEPLESFLQNLHQVWLNEKLEQERRLAIFKFKMADIASKNVTSPASINPIVEPLESDPVYESLHVFNSRRYMSRVQTLKGALPSGLNLKRARLLLASVGTMRMKMSLTGEHGSFYDEGAIVRLINQRRAEQENVFDTSSEGGLDRVNSFSNLPSHSPSSVSQLIPITPVSPAPRPAVLTDPSCFSFLAAQYIAVSVENISVHLRNFPAPLFTCSQVTVAGSVAVAQTRPEFVGDHQKPVLSPSYTSPQSAVLAQLMSPPLKDKGHTRTSSEPPNLTLKPTARPGSAMKATVSVGGVHEVALELRYRPFQLFYDMSVSINDAEATFAPHYVYPLNDILKAINKITPPLPHLYPIQPIRLLAGQTRSAMKRADAPILPINYLHLMRAIAHGKLVLNVENTVVHLFATPSPYETSKYLNVNVRSVSVLAHGALVRVGVKEVKLNHNTSKAQQQNLIEVPSVEIGVTVNWLCTNDCSDHEPAASPTNQLVKSPTNQPASPSVSLSTPFVSHVSLGRSHSDACHTARRHVSIGDEDEGDITALSHHRKRPAALKHIRGHSRQHSNHQLSRQFSGSAQNSMEHTCRMHVSLCVSLIPPSSSPPLSVTLHSGSLLALASIGTLYSQIPPYPMPNRGALRVYYEKYHRTRMTRYIKALSSQVDLQHATLVLLEDNMNDLMIGMLARVEIDSAVLGGSDTIQSTFMLSAGDKVSESDRKVVRQLSSQYPHLGPHYSEMIGAPADAPVINLHEDRLPRAQALTESTKSQEIRLALGGLYLERFCLESLAITVWEGANLGPARGICLAINSVDFCAEAVHERDMRSIPVDGLKHSKIFIDLTEKIPDSTDSESSDYDIDQSPSWRSSPSLSPSVSGELALPHHVRSVVPAPVPNIWSVSNTILRVRDVQCSIVHNQQWQNLDRLDDQLTGGNGASRVVVYTYENQRYIPGKGWSKSNLFPTDRPGWSNVNGTEEVTKESIKLPSSEWEWETDWQLDFGLRRAGEVDEEGWEYSHDFPRKYSRVRTWHVSVRRRRWIRIRKLKTSNANSSAHDANKRQHKKVENAVNFLASVTLVSVHQKPYLHTQDVVSVLVDERRSQFRQWLCVMVKKSRQPASSSASGLPKTTSLDFDSIRRTHVRSTSTVSVSSAPSDTSLLSYFHIRDAHDESAPRYLDEEDVLHSTRPLLNSSAVPSTLQRPMSSARNTRSVMDLSPSLSRFAARGLPEPSSSNDTLELPSDEMRMSPLLELPTQHQIRILDPKMLLTVEIRATLCTLIDQYSAVLKELLAEDHVWLQAGIKQERQCEADQRVRARQEMEALSEDVNVSPNNGRRASVPRATSNLQTPGGSRGRFASAEDASVRPQIPLNRSLTPSSSSFSVPSSRVPVGHVPSTDGDSFAGVTAGPVFRCNCRIGEIASEAQEFFCLEVVNPQINIHSMETRGRLLFMTNRVTLYGRIDWLRSVHHTQSERIVHTVNIPLSGPDAVPPAVVIDAQQIYKSSVATTDFVETAMPVISRDKFRLSIVLDEVQAFVAPTDIDVDAGVIWMTSANRGVLKSIMQPATLQINAVIRPELIPFRNVTLDDPLDFTTIPPPQSKVSSADISRSVFSFTAAPLYDDPAELVSPKTATTIPPPAPVLPEHALVVSTNSSNMIDIQLPELSFNLDAYQFSLLVDVLTTVTAAMPIHQGDDDVDRVLVNTQSLVQLKKEAVLGTMLLHQMIWSMKTISTSLSSMQRQQEENEREVQPISLSSPSSTNYASFQTWLLETTNRIDRERELAVNGNTDSVSMFGLEDLHSRFHQLLSKHNELTARVFALLQAIHYKQDQLKETKLQYLNVSVMCERVNFMMMKNEQAFTNLYVDELGVTFAAKSDSTLDTSVEIKSIGARNLLAHYQDSHRQEHQWQELVQLLSPNRLTGNDALFSSAWNYKELMFHATLMLKVDAHHVTVSHCEINLHPISVKLTYESISQIIDYFVHEQQQLQKKYASDRAKFLPLSQVVLDLNAMQINQQTQGGSTSLPPSPTSKGIKQRMKGMAQKMRRPFTHAEHSKTIDDDDDVASIDSDTEASLAQLKTLKSGMHSSSSKIDSSHMANSADSSVQKADEESTVSFNYVRLGSSLIVVSYWSGGYTKYKIEDFQGLPIKVKPLLIQNKEWTMSRMGSHLKKEMIRMALGQMGEALGKFLAYKMGFAKSNAHSGALDEIALQAYHQSNDAADDVSLAPSASGLVPQPIDFEPSISATPSHIVSSTQTISPIITAAPVKTTMSSPSTPSALHNMAASSRKIGQNVKLLFGDLSKSTKKRKDSDALTSAAPPSLISTPTSSSLDFDPLVLLQSSHTSQAPPSNLPPRQPQVSISADHLNDMTSLVSSPPPVPARPRAGSNSSQSLQPARDLPRRGRTPIPVYAEDLQEYEEEEIH